MTRLLQFLKAISFKLLIDRAISKGVLDGWASCARMTRLLNQWLTSCRLATSRFDVLVFLIWNCWLACGGRLLNKIPIHFSTWKTTKVVGVASRWSSILSLIKFVELWSDQLVYADQLYCRARECCWGFSKFFYLMFFKITFLDGFFVIDV